MYRRIYNYDLINKMLSVACEWILCSLTFQARYGNEQDVKRRGILQLGKPNTVILDVDESIIEVSVTWAKYICSLSFRTSSQRTFGPYSTQHASCTNEPENSSIVKMSRLLYLGGKSGSWLDSIELVFTVWFRSKTTMRKPRFLAVLSSHWPIIKLNNTHSLAINTPVSLLKLTT